MDLRRIAIAVFTLVSVSHVGCSQSCCEYRHWHSWSSCNYPCGTWGSQTRIRGLMSSLECYENCSYLQQTRRCSGILPVDCQLSSWSEWSSCSFSGRCNFSRFQTSTRHISKMEQCGGSCKDAVYQKTRQCACLNEGFPDENGTCLCKGDFFGPCCEQESRENQQNNENSQSK